jgi:ActR/RegA family two-component response regulator
MITAASSLLIVEDDLALAGYLAAALGDQGYVVRQAHDRAQAMKYLTPHEPQGLVLLDLGLPPQPSTMAEGLALLDDLLRLAPDAKIIVLTGQDENAAALEAVRRGAFDFLVKPATLETITQALSRAKLFVREETRLAEVGEARLHLTARYDEGPREVAAAAEEQLLRRVLTETGYNIAETGRRLGLAREHVYYYLNKYGIQRPG